MFKSCKKGFTLLEVVITIFFLGFSLLTLSQLFAGSKIRSAAMVHVSLAAQLAQEKLEEIYSVKSAQGYTAVNSTNFPSAAEDLTSQGYPGWTRQTSIQFTPANNYDGTLFFSVGVKRATVTVSWPGGSRSIAGIFTNWP